VTVSQTSFEDAPVTIQAEATATGYGGETIVARLIKVSRPPGAKPGGGATGSNQLAAASSGTAPVEKLVAEQRQRAAHDGEPVSFRFQVKPEEAGLSFYRVQVLPKEDVEGAAGQGAAGQPRSSSEATLANNHRVVVADRGHGPYRVLYLAGRPNWEY